MKRIKLIFLLLALAVVASQGKSYSVSDVKITSFEVIKLEPHDGHCAKAWVDLTFDNPFANFELSDITMSLFIDNQWYVDLVVDPTECFVLKKGGQHRVFTTEVVLSPDVNPFLLLSVVKSVNRPAIKFVLEGRPALRGGLGAKIKIEHELDDIYFGSIVKETLEGYPINYSTKVWDIIGTVNSFDLQDIRYSEGRAFKAEVRLGLNMTKTVWEWKDRLTISRINGVLSLDGIPLAELQIPHSHVLDKGNKPYSVVIEGKMDESFNPCMLLSFLKNKSSWPAMTFKGGVRLPYAAGMKLPIVLP